MVHIEINQTVKMQQEFLLSQDMQKALHILQMPALELADWIENELSLNPILEKKESVPERYSYLQAIKQPIRKKPMDHPLRESPDYWHTIPSSLSMYEYLMQQASLLFSCKKDLWIAEQLIGSLNERGYLEDLPFELKQRVEQQEIEKVLTLIQGMDPIGIGARSLQECLCIQLKEQGKASGLFYTIIKDSFDDFLNQRMSALSKKYSTTIADLQKIIKEMLKSLNPNPGGKFNNEIARYITPDVSIYKCSQGWKIQLQTNVLNTFCIHQKYKENYIAMQEEEKKFMQKHLRSARWIFSAVKRRSETLQKIVSYILEKQNPFFELGENRLIPMTLHEIAEELGMSDSTITRAVANKYLSCIWGIFSLKSFFSSSSSKLSADVSSRDAKQILRKIIGEENKTYPLSDTELVKKMQRMGFKCARRTINKYRKALKIAPAAKRKIHV